MNEIKTQAIIDNALSYLGQHEKKGNSGFLDPVFEAEMKEEGWQYGWAWCAVFAKVVFKNVYPEKAEVLNKLFSPSAVTTFNNFKKADYKISTLPVIGSLCIWQMMKEGKPQISGHAGIPVKLNSSWEFQSVEGNGSEAGSREGTTVVLQPNRKTEKYKFNGLKVLGFIQI